MPRRPRAEGSPPAGGPCAAPGAETAGRAGRSPMRAEVALPVPGFLQAAGWVPERPECALLALMVLIKGGFQPACGVEGRLRVSERARSQEERGRGGRERRRGPAQAEAPLGSGGDLGGGGAEPGRRSVRARAGRRGAGRGGRAARRPSSEARPLSPARLTLFLRRNKAN